MLSSTDTDSDGDSFPVIQSHTRTAMDDLSDTDTNSDDDLQYIKTSSQTLNSKKDHQIVSPRKKIRKQMSRQDFISDSSDIEIDEEKSFIANEQLIPLKDRILNAGCRGSPKLKKFKKNYSNFYTDGSDVESEINCNTDVVGISTNRSCSPITLSGDSNDSNYRGTNHRARHDVTNVEHHPLPSLLNRGSTSKTFESVVSSKMKSRDEISVDEKSSVPTISSASSCKPTTSVYNSHPESDGILKIRKKRSAEEIAEQKRIAQLKREQREKEKAEKQREKEEKKAQKERETKLKKQFGLIKDSLGFLKVILDTHLVNSLGLGAVVMKSCDTLGNGLQCLVQDQTLPYTVSWRRSVTQVSDGSTTDRDEDEVITVIPLTDFIQLVDNTRMQQMGPSGAEEKTLTDFILFSQQVFTGCQLTPVVIGMEKYFRDKKTAAQRKYREAVTSELQKQKKGRKGGNSLDVSRVEVEQAVTEAQLRTGCVVKMLDTSEEFADLVKSFTKAVAEKPAKKDRLNSIFSFHEDGSTGVRVDKSGQGLLKVWKQQLLQFKNVSPDIADAILALFPSPRQLTQAYLQCSSEKEAIQVLENIVVRRGAGVLETNRKIGKEMSRRIYTFMTSELPELVIK